VRYHDRVQQRSHTNRDTFAFMLTILGASSWAMVPTAVVLQGEGVGPNVGLPVVFAVGAFLGAWSGTTVWRHVTWVLPAIAAALVAAAAMGLRHRAVEGSFGIEIAGIAAIVGAAAGGAIGARLGWRARTARRVLVAAWIAFSGPALLGIGIGLSVLLGYEPTESVVWLIFAAFLPGAILAARLCRNVHPGSFFTVHFGLLLSFLLIAAIEGDASPEAAFVGGFFFSAVVAGISTIPIGIAYRPEAEAAELPTATIVER
jgi:hypothetical protein